MEEVKFYNENLEEIEKDINMINNEENFLIKYKGNIVNLMEFQQDKVNGEYPRYIQFFKNEEEYKEHKFYDSGCVLPSKMIEYIKHIVNIHLKHKYVVKKIKNQYILNNYFNVNKEFEAIIIHYNKENLHKKNEKVNKILANFKKNNIPYEIVVDIERKFYLIEYNKVKKGR
jgi:hypothetical protein